MSSRANKLKKAVKKSQITEMSRTLVGGICLSLAMLNPGTNPATLYNYMKKSDNIEPFTVQSIVAHLTEKFSLSEEVLKYLVLLFDTSERFSPAVFVRIEGAILPYYKGFYSAILSHYYQEDEAICVESIIDKPET